MSSSLHAANIKSKQAQKQPHLPAENGLKVKISLPSSTKTTSKEPKTSSTKSSRPKSSSAAGSSLQSPEITIAKSLVNGNHGAAKSSVPNAIRPKPVPSTAKQLPGKSTIPQPNKPPIFNGNPSSLPHMDKMQQLFFGSPNPHLPPTLYTVSPLPFPTGNNNGKQNSDPAFMSKISAILGRSQKILPAEQPSFLQLPNSLTVQVSKPDLPPPQTSNARKEPVAIRPAFPGAIRTDGKKQQQQQQLPPLFFTQQQPPQLLMTPANLYPPNSMIFSNGSAIAPPPAKRQISPTSARSKQTSPIPTKAKPVKRRKNDEKSKQQPAETPMFFVLPPQVNATPIVPSHPAPPQSSSEDLDQLLNSLQKKITKEFASSTNILSPNVLSPNESSDPVPLPSTSRKKSSLSPAEIKKRLKNQRKSIQVVDLAVEESVEKLTGAMGKISLENMSGKKKAEGDGMASSSKTPSAEPSKLKTQLAKKTPATIPVIAEGPVCSLPFKKRIYKSVPSPKEKSKEQSDATKSSAKEGRNTASTVSATQSKSPGISTVTSKSKEVPNVSPAKPAIKLSFKLTGNQAVVCATSPQSLSSPSISANPSAASRKAKKRKAEDLIPDGIIKRKPSLTKSRPQDGDFAMQSNYYKEPHLKIPHRDSNLMQCDCRLPEKSTMEGCGVACSGRNSSIECDPELCPCGSRCSNQTIQKGLGVADLELFQTKNKGQGVRSKTLIKKGTFICEYIGEVVSMDKFRDRMQFTYKESAHHYCLGMDGNKVIDAYRCGSIARFINHSCEPNSETQKWLVSGQDRMAIFAKQDIPAGEEITYDYKFDSFDVVQQPCHCGAKACRGFLGIKKSTKLNGLLMQKKQRPAETPLPITPRIISVSQPNIIPVVAITPPPKPLSPIPVLFPELDLLQDKEVILKDRICLPRNLRSSLKRKTPAKRPKIINPFRVTDLPGMASEATKLLNLSIPTAPVAKCFPAEYFKPIRWEPTAEELVLYSNPPFEEEVIRCICNNFLDEGPMVDCDNCKVWQHCECMGIIPSKKEQRYTCDRCSPRPVPQEIHHNLPATANEDNLDCYVTLEVPNCQKFFVRVGDCVYLTKDRQPVVADGMYDPITVDILHIDNMWIQDGVKFIFGHHYLRPHEIFHEANRSFYENELFLSPQHLETVKLDAVLGRCCIMDSVLFAKGKPKEYPLEHCFICDKKVNKACTVFTPLTAKEKWPITLDKYYFEYYPEKLNVRRTFKPHQVPLLKKKIKADAARRDSDTPTNLIKRRCQRIHSVLDSLTQRQTS